MNNKKVSVIVPAYNAEKLISRTLDSIINQEYKNLEIIVIDDGSKDKTKEVIKKYATKDDRIIPYYSELNQGVSKTRNMGLKTFTGDYVMFVDADDVITPDAISTMVKESIDKKADVVDSYHLVIYKDKKNNKIHYFTEGKIPKQVLVMGSSDDNIEVLTKSTYITGKLIKKDLLKNLYFDESLRRYEDLVFEHRLKQRLKNFLFLNDVYYYYYQVSTSLINTLGVKHEVYLDAAAEVMKIYEKESKEKRTVIESMLVTNAFLTGITKIVKNDLSLEENTEILYNYLNKINEVFPKWKKNEKISNFIKKRLIKLQNDKEKVKKTIKKTKKTDFIRLYFRFLSIIHKYKQK